MKTIRKFVTRVLPFVLTLMLVTGGASVSAFFWNTDNSLPAIETFAKSVLVGNSVQFSQGDFTSRVSGNSKLEGIVITELPDAGAGVLRFGSRDILTGEAITLEGLDALHFVPLSYNEIQTAFAFLPVFKEGVGTESVSVSINLLGHKNNPPVAEEIEIITYKNVPVTGSFKATDPDGDKLSYKIVEKPARGEILIKENGEFVYTPYQNKTGSDKFTYSAVDQFGAVSDPVKAAVTIEKQKTKVTYSDMENHSAYYAALRLAENGIFVGEQLGSSYFFNPDQPVSRGEFVAMTVSAIGLDSSAPVSKTGFADDSSTPVWVKPYVAAALKAGIVTGIVTDSGQREFGASYDMTRGEAAVIINNAIRLTDQSVTTVFSDDDTMPAWARQAAINLEAIGVMASYSDGSLRLMETMTRAEAAQLICSALDAKTASEKKDSLLSWALG